MGPLNIFSRPILNPWCPVDVALSLPKDEFISYQSSPVLYPLYCSCYFLLYPTSHCFPSSQNLPLGLFCSMIKINASISSTISLFALRKSCFPCSTLKGCLFFHLSSTPSSQWRVIVLTIPLSQSPVKRKQTNLSQCNCCTSELPRNFLKSHCPDYTPIQIKSEQLRLGTGHWMI